MTTTFIIHNTDLCIATTKSGKFCKNKKKIGDVCSLHSKNITPPPFEELTNKNIIKPTNNILIKSDNNNILLKTETNLIISINSPNLCHGTNKNNSPCKNKIKKGNRLYCQVHSKSN